MVINCYPFSLALSCSCSSFMSGMEFDDFFLLSIVSVSFDDAPHGNDEQSSYMRCQLHTHPYTQTYGNSLTPIRYRCEDWTKGSGLSFIGTAISDHERTATNHFDHDEVCGKMGGKNCGENPNSMTMIQGRVMVRTIQG